jgi:beta-lactamase superfamily II metal-dependent hydrolase
MNKALLRKIGIILFAIISILIIIISCNSPSDLPADRVTEVSESDIENQKSVEIEPNISPGNNKEEDKAAKDHYHIEEENDKLNWKTDEIFDSSTYSDKLTVRFFHTDIAVDGSAEGDSILIIAPDGASMLIDAGLPDCGSILVDFLRKLGIEKLDYAVGTHMHIDHIGGYVDVLNNIDVDTMVFPNFVNYNTSIAKGLLATLDNKKIEVEIVKKGDRFKLGEYVDIEVLSPEYEIVVPEGTVPEKSAGFVNNHSLVLKMTYKNNTFLFPADIYWEREDILIEEQGGNLKVDVLKVPHHGSHTSSSIRFVNAVEPKIAIMTSISPDKEVYDRYKRKGSDIYITGLDGNILVFTDGENIEVIQEHERTIKGYYD